MTQENTNYFLNDGCIADSLTADLGAKQRFAVPHLSVLGTVDHNIRGITQTLSDAIDGLDYTKTIGIGELISSVTQEDGKVSVGVKRITTEDISSVGLIPDDFSKRFGKRRIRFRYDSESKRILLGVAEDETSLENMLAVDCNDFIKDGFLDHVETGTDIMGPFIKLIWNTDAGKDENKLYVKELLGGIYKGLGIIKINDNLQVSADVAQLREEIDYNNLYNYYEFLAGLREWADKGAIKTLSDDVSVLFQTGAKDLKYVGHIDDPEKLSTRTMVDYFRYGLPDLTALLNGSYFPVKFADNSMSVATIDSVNPLVVGNGDVVIIHSHDDVWDVPVSSLVLGDNVHVLKAGVSRYEYEKGRRDINCISDFIDANLGNFPNKDAERIETKKDVLISSSLYANNVSSENLTANHIFTDSLSASNLSIEPIDLKEGEVAKILTSVGETSGIIEISSAILEQKMVSCLTADLSNLSSAAKCNIQVSVDVHLSDFNDGINDGDIAILSSRINQELKGEPIQYSTTGYIWRKDISAWIAMNGNYSAENVYFSKNIELAGKYIQVGNIEISSDVLSCAGRSVQDVFTEIFDKVIQPLSGTLPTVNVRITSSTAEEVGTEVTPSYRVDFTQGKYIYPWLFDQTSAVNDGTAAKTYSVVDSNGSTATLSSGSLGKFRVEDSTKYVVSANVSYDDGFVAKNNKGRDSNPIVQHKASTTLTVKSSNQITGFRKTFYYVGTSVATEEQLSDSAFIRSNATSSDNSVKTSKSLEIPKGTMMIWFAVKGNRTLSSVIDVDGMGLDIKNNFTKILTDISGKTAGEDLTQYSIFYVICENASGYDKTTYNFTIS